MHYPKWRTILENDYSLQIASEDAYVTKETQKFLRLFDRAISMIAGQPNAHHAFGVVSNPTALLICAARIFGIV